MNPDRISRFPLQWPAGWKRTDRWSRASGKFTRHGREISLPQAVERLIVELGRFAIHERDVVISTNVPTRLDGLPRGDYRAPEDPGAAVYWRDGGTTRCMAIDRYTKVEHNVAALAATIEAMRAIERHGGAAILERAFDGFAALPAPSAARDWQAVLGIGEILQPTIDDAERAYRRLRSTTHPDRGGSDAAFAEVQRAWEQAQEALR